MHKIEPLGGAPVTFKVTGGRNEVAIQTMKLKLQTYIPADGRLVAYENELKVLKAVNLFGHLRRADIAAAVWPMSPPESGLRMCGRTLKRLLEAGELVEKPNTHGSMSVVLTPKGARRLKGVGVEADDGRKLSSVDGSQFYHRTLGTRYLIDKTTDTNQVFGEYAFIKGRAPVSRAHLSEQFHKYPDGLIITPGEERGYNPGLTAADWVEVESNLKNDDDYEKLISVAWKVGTWLNASETCVLDRLVFVFDVRQRHQAALTSYLRRHVVPQRDEHALQVLHSIVFARVQLRMPLVWERVTEVTAAQALGITADEFLN